jgi:GT2 family glycosyltransferase
MASLQPEPHITCDIFLINNASPLFDEKVVRERFPSVNIVHNKVRMGFAANHNQALSKATGRYALILNDDTVVSPGCFQRLIKFADEHPEAGFFGPRLTNEDGSLQTSAYRFPSPYREAMEALNLHLFLGFIPAMDTYKGWKHDSPRYVDFLSGAALMVRKDVLEKIGLLDDRFFIYSEESDWCYRGKKAGYKVLFVPDATISHVGGKSSTGRSGHRSVEFLRSHGKYIRKHYGLTGLAVFKVSCLVKHLQRCVAYHILPASDERRMLERDQVLWSLGLLNRPGLAELARSER